MINYDDTTTKIDLTTLMLTFIIYREADMETNCNKTLSFILSRRDENAMVEESCMIKNTPSVFIY